MELACGNVPECQPLIMEAVKWHLLPERRSLLFSHRTRPRTSTIGRLLAIGGMDGYKVLTLTCYKTLKDLGELLKSTLLQS